MENRCARIPADPGLALRRQKRLQFAYVVPTFERDTLPARRHIRRARPDAWLSSFLTRSLLGHLFAKEFSTIGSSGPLALEESGRRSE